MESDTEYHWHACGNCGHQCPHEGEFCHCPWCGNLHEAIKKFRLDPKLDGDGIRHSTPFSEFDARMMVIVGELRLLSGVSNYTYEGEHQIALHGWGQATPTLVVNHPELLPGVRLTITHPTAWEEIQRKWSLGWRLSGEEAA